MENVSYCTIHVLVQLLDFWIAVAIMDMDTVVHDQCSRYVISVLYHVSRESSMNLMAVRVLCGVTRIRSNRANRRLGGCQSV